MCLFLVRFEIFCEQFVFRNVSFVVVVVVVVVVVDVR